MESNIVSYEPQVHDNDSLHNIINVLKFYVFDNPENIHFSTTFITAFRNLLDLDNILVSDLESFKVSDQSINNSVDLLKLNLFRLQLRIVLKRKLIIQKECPDNPNIKRLIEIFNSKIEALVKLVDAQNEMEGDIDNPLASAYIEMVDEANITTQIYKQSELYRTAKNTLRDMTSNKERLEKIITDNKTRCKIMNELNTFHQNLRLKWTDAKFQQSLERIHDYKKEYEQCVSETNRLQLELNKNDETLKHFTTVKYHSIEDKLKKMMESAKKDFETSKAVLERNNQAINEELKLIFSSVTPITINKDFETIHAKIASTPGQQANIKTCSDEFNQKYLDIMRRLTETFDESIKVKTKLQINDMMFKFTQNFNSALNENSYKKKIEIAEARASIIQIDNVITSIQNQITSWNQVNATNSKIPSHMILIIKESFQSMLNHFTEMKTKHTQLIAKSQTANPNPNTNGNDNQNLLHVHVCERDQELLKLEQLKSVTMKYTKDIQNLTVYIQQLVTHIKQVYTKALEVTQFNHETVDVFVTNLNTSRSKYLEHDDKRMKIRDEIFSRQQEQVLLQFNIQMLNQTIQHENTIAHTFQQTVGFGSNTNLYSVYSLYQQTYVLYYSPAMIQSYVLLINSLNGIPDKSVVVKYVPLHYEQIDDSIILIIRDLYDVTIDTNCTKIFNKTIHLTSDQPSLIVQNITLHLPDDIDTTHATDHNVHVGMCLLTVLKSYLHRPETINDDFVNIAREWLVQKQSLFQNTNKEEIKSLFGNFVSFDKDESSCNFVLYEQCDSVSRDPMYRFAVHDSTYFPKYSNLQIDYYNTCLPIGYDQTSRMYNRDNAVKYLDQNYNSICEHYMLENKLSHIYLHKNNVLNNDTYFNKTVLNPLISPSIDVTVQWKFCTIVTKKSLTNPPLNIIHSILTNVIDTINKNKDIERTEFKNYYETEIVRETKDLGSFCVIFYWKNKTTSKLYIIDVPSDHTDLDDDEHHKPIQKETDESIDFFLRVKHHSFMHYDGIQSLMDPCYTSRSSLIRFEVPKEKNDSENFGTFCDLTTRKYTHKHVWIVLNTTDCFIRDPFLCTIPYIDDTFIEILNDLRMIHRAQNIRDNDTSIKRMNYFKELCYEYVVSKIKRLSDESTESTCTNDTENLKNISMDLFPENLDGFIVKLTEHNEKTSIGKLFRLLGHNKNIVFFNSNVSEHSMTRFYHYFVDTLKNFLRLK